MNKEETRVQVQLYNIPYIDSGDLRIITNFLPVIYTSKLKAWWKGLLYGSYLVPVTIVTNWVPDDRVGTYMWLRLKATGRVYKVWWISSYSPSNSSLVFLDGNVMVKGIGMYPMSDFDHFIF